MFRTGLLILAISAGAARLGAGGSAADAPQLLSTSGEKGGVDPAQLEKLAAGGNPSACVTLGALCETGEGVKIDPPRARALYAQAAAAGHPTGAYCLGRVLQGGIGGGADPAQARRFYEFAAVAGLPVAQYDLGAMLAGGHGVQRDYVEGLAWLILASGNHAGGDGEQRLRAHLAKRPQDIAAAEQRAAVLRQRIEAARTSRPTPPEFVPPPDPSAAAEDPLKPAAPKVTIPVAGRPTIAPPVIDLAPAIPPPSSSGDRQDKS